VNVIESQRSQRSDPLRTAAELLEEATSSLGSVTEARWIVETATRWDGSRLHSPSELRRDVSRSVAEEIDRMVRRRRGGEPLQYVLGTWAFRDLEIRVDPRVLVPRPETEQVVGFALEELRGASERSASSGRGRRVVAVDLGTGSGVIALSIALEASLGNDRPLEVWATDFSGDALAVARTNLETLGARRPEVAARVRLRLGSWFDALPSRLRGEIQLVVSNPPYVSASEWESLDPVVREHEPAHALVAGETGREVLELLVSEAPRWLAPMAAVVLELAPSQARSIADKAAASGFDEVMVLPDLSGRPRALIARRGVG